MRRPDERSDDLPEEPEELSDNLLRCLVAMVQHPRLKEHVRHRARSLPPCRLAWEVARLHQAEQALLEQWPSGAGLRELRAVALERITDTLCLAVDEMDVLAILESDDDTLHPAQQLLRKATFLLVGLLERMPVDPDPDEGLADPDPTAPHGEPFWLH